MELTMNVVSLGRYLVFFLLVNLTSTLAKETVTREGRNIEDQWQNSVENPVCPEAHPCDVICINRSVLVDCSHRNITEVGDLNLPLNTTWLDLSFNNLTSISNGSFEDLQDLKCLNLSYNLGFHLLEREAFRGLTNLKVLNITALRNSSYIYQFETPVYIYNGTFTFMPKLETLILNYWTGYTVDHQKNFQDIICDFKNSKSIKHIYANGINTIEVVWVLQSPLFECIQNTSLEKLVMMKNFIVSIRPPVLDYLKNLKHLDISYNVIVGGDIRLLRFDLHMMSKLRTLRMSYQSYIHFSNKIYPDLSDHGQIPFPHHKKQNPHLGDISSMVLPYRDKFHRSKQNNCTVQIHLPPNLKKLFISHRNSIVHGFVLDGICVNSSNKLELLDISNNWLEECIFGPVLNFPNLKRLNMHGSRMVFSSIRMFQVLQKLEYLSVSKCALHEVIEFESRKQKKPLYTIWEEITNQSNLLKLKFLNMRANSLEFLPPNLFERLHNLEHVILSENRLANLSFNLSHLTNLRNFNLSFNKISFVSSELLDLLPRTKEELILNLANNSLLSGTCSDTVSLKILLDVYESSVRLRKNITVIISNKTAIIRDHRVLRSMYDEKMSYCYTQKWIAGYAIYFGTLLLATVMTIVRRKRWRFVYVWKYIKLILHKHKRDSSDLTGKEYDAFICYSHHDYHWVIKELQPVLENHHGYKLCIHERDFEPGAPIDVNILHSFCLSRAVILVITQKALQSSFLNFELHIAREHNGNVICVMLEDPSQLNSETVPPTLQFFMETMTYLRWSDDKEKQKSFWKRMKKSLGKPMSELLVGGSLEASYSDKDSIYCRTPSVSSRIIHFD